MSEVVQPAPAAPLPHPQWHVSLCDLSLKIEGTILAPAVARLLRELQDAGLTRLVPHCYLTTEWVVVNETICLGIPFFLARPDLIELYATLSEDEVWSGPEDLAVVLRHEMGHVVNYAYELFKRPDWVEHFGPWAGEDEWVRDPIPGDPNYVVHLSWPEDYAQKNPDEDWAETFALWMTPDRDWRKEYAGKPGALAKLECCDRLMRELGGQEPAAKEVWLGWDIANKAETLAEFFEAEFSEEES